MSHYDFTSVTAISIFLTVGVILGGLVFTYFMYIFQWIYVLVLGTALLIIVSPIILLEVIITGKTTIGEHITILRFLNKEKKKKLFDDW